MRGKTGTSTNGTIHRRPSQKGDRRCKDCKHLIYLCSVKKGEQFNYYCKVAHQPKHYTTKCYCSHYREKQL